VAEEPAIELKNVEKEYRDGLFGRRVPALRGVSFSVERGEIFGLLGPNGAGKTTLVKVLLGIVRRTGGSARMLGHEAGHIEARRLVGYLPEHHRIPRHHTANTALEYYASLSGMSMAEIRDRRPALLERVGLGEWGDTCVGKYSKGMQQRLGLAQALLHEPELLILDEPTDGVDPVGRADMRAILQELKDQGKTIFVNSHLLQEIELICDRIAILQSGTVRHTGKVAELTQKAGGEYGITVAAPAEQVQAALGQRTLIGCSEDSNGNTRVLMQIADQAALDGVVDALRSAGLSIARAAREKQTLEDAFISLVKASGEGSDLEAEMAAAEQSGAD
jgi:ABC-2 type transport system ATP-binding protein